jgi:hypothetical protein
MDKVMTVVLKGPAGSDLRQKVLAAFKDNKPFMGAQITAISLEDEITRVEKLEEQLAVREG